MDQPEKNTKREAILAKAFKQWRHSRSLIDPAVLTKIRETIAKHPLIMKALGVKKEEIPQTDKDVEVVDQGKTMEIMAKLMEIKPEGKEQIKSAIKEARR